MLRFIARRLALAVITLVLLSAIVFVIANVLPSDVGRQILGPFATPESVAALNKTLGTDKPIYEQYLNLLGNLITFDFGNSYQSGGTASVSDAVLQTLGNSAKLAALALVLIVPLGVAGGVIAALTRTKKFTTHVTIIFGVLAALALLLTRTVSLTVILLAVAAVVGAALMVIRRDSRLEVGLVALFGLVGVVIHAIDGNINGVFGHLVITALVALGTLMFRRRGLLDRVIVLVGLSGSAIPEFVTSTFLVMILGQNLNIGVNLDLLPALANAPPGASIPEQIKYLLLPALAMVIVYFGYIARMARAGTMVALEADYTRTAVMKGIPWRTVIGRHVLRNALLPTISVVATQIGYLFGGLLAVELIFNYNGLGRLLVTAAKAKDLPVLQAGVLTIGIIYMIATLLADILISYLNPRIRLGAEG